ncbi:hypothetical protein [Dyella sp. 2RAF44]|uniref:hypothetical protein n=1 Tax=Dyella sp. 2RAF44 TaxID=3233000 RepID=UPI003F8DADC2
MPSTSPCGIGGSTNANGECTGTIGQQASDGLGKIIDGLSSTSITGALIAAAVIVAAVLFARWGGRKVAAFFGAREAELKRQQDAADAETRAADSLRSDYRRNTNYADLGQKLHEAGEWFDREDDREDDVEDDAESDEALEYDGGRRS